jgi:hypothetical protein
MADRQLQRAKQCGRKVRYKRLADALKARQEIYRRHNDRMNAYKCPFCRRWHLGHSAPWRKPKRQRLQEATRAIPIAEQATKNHFRDQNDRLPGENDRLPGESDPTFRQTR